MTSKPSAQPGRTRIDSWKEIAALFGRDERTVKRWEKERGLPVHRIPGGSRGSVYAFKEELTAWLEAKQQAGGADLSEPIELPVETPFESPIQNSGTANRVRLVVAAFVVLVTAGIILGVRHIQATVAKAHSKPSAGPAAAAAARHEAEDLYLQGRFYWNTRTPEGLTQSVDYFTKATQRDPTYALGYAGLADSYNLLREYTNMPGSEAFPLALAAARKAIELDDSLAEAHRALAFASFNWSWDVPGAEHEYRRAIELKPADAQSHHWYATMLMELARYDESIHEIDQARQLDPSSKSIAADRGLILYSSGRHEEAASSLRALEQTEPGFSSPHSYLAGIYFDQKQYEKSFAESKILAKLTGSDPSTVNLNEQLFKTGGEKALLEGILARQLDDFQNGRGGALDVAQTYARLENKKESLEYLERAYQRHEYVLVSLPNNRLFEFIAGDPEYLDLLKRIGMSRPAGT